MADQPLAPLSHLTAVDALVLIGDVIPTLKTHQLLVLHSDGHWYFQNPGTGAYIVEAQAIEDLLKQHGLQVTPNVDRVIAMLPILLPLLAR